MRKLNLIKVKNILEGNIYYLYRSVLIIQQNFSQKAFDQ